MAALAPGGRLARDPEISAEQYGDIWPCPGTEGGVGLRRAAVEIPAAVARWLFPWQAEAMPRTGQPLARGDGSRGLGCRVGYGLDMVALCVVS
jgi:hypothetical protein